MGGKCCKGEELKDGQPELMSQTGALSPTPTEEEAIKSIPSATPKHRKIEVEEIAITLKKTSRCSRLGVDVDLSENTYLLVDKVNDGLVMEWNKANPAKSVKTNDRIISVNGTKGDAHAMTEVCKKDDDLEMVVHRAQ
eukprot:CAMPEP_0172659502 /NCGR_PEP_ID=MMETSP1074-20121228/3477_1 /TAXON_ID=2916 /ORGANISM="Ceratium fusus, Strain PA161109" /LENGTH=137 /DNA_ID=CAMNT_0013474989 /DNA_START=56 /DNA_END=469 /DNA_ORIENTATION=+